MELYQLRYFAAIAQAGSMKAAAATCHVTQPTLSGQIKQLEEELGTALLERHPWGIRLTPAGTQVLESARRIFTETDRLRDALQPVPAGHRSVLRVGVLPTIATEILSGRLQQLLVESPHTRLIVKERINSQLVELLTAEQVDVCVMLRPKVELPDVGVEPLIRLPYAAYSRSDHPLAGKTRLGLLDLLPYPLLLFTGAMDTLTLLEQAAKRQRVGLHVAFKSDQAMTAFSMAGEGSGVALLPQLFGDRCRRLRLRQIPVDDARLHVEVCAVRRQNSPATPLADRLVEMTRQHLKRLAARTPR
jgi:LysR family hydrogen peroxide-inducible transcriptional activator